MPYLAKLARELDLMRTGRGPHRVELRQRLAAIDAGLRRARNVEALTLAGLRSRLRSLDQRVDPAPLMEAAEESARRLAALDQQVAAAVAQQLAK